MDSKKLNKTVSLISSSKRDGFLRWFQA